MDGEEHENWTELERVWCGVVDSKSSRINFIEIGIQFSLSFLMPTSSPSDLIPLPTHPSSPLPIIIASFYLFFISTFSFNFSPHPLSLVVVRTESTLLLCLCSDGHTTSSI